MALIVIDLDRFRDINSIFGDDIGDRVLERLADAMSVARTGITIGRIGGDEFILLIEHATNPDMVMQVANDISAALGDEVVVDGLTCRLSASMGIAQYPKDGASQRNLMQAAGVSLCHAKAKGRGQVCFYSENMEQRSEESLQMENDLRRAISDGELLMFYQPQVDLRTGQCIGAEALCAGSILKRTAAAGRVCAVGAGHRAHHRHRPVRDQGSMCANRAVEKGGVRTR